MPEILATEDGSVFPAPRERTVHRHTFKTRSGYDTAVAVEIVYDGFTLVAAGSGVQGAMVADLIAAIAARRSTEGYKILSLTNSSAHLEKIQGW